MDANRLRPFQIADDGDWVGVGDPPDLRYDGASRLLRLASRRPQVDWPDNAAAAPSLVEQVPGTIDAHGTHARYDAPSGQIVASGAFPNPVSIFFVAAGQILTDMAAANDGILYLALDGQILMKDLRDRWNPVTVGAPGFSAWRLAARPVLAAPRSETPLFVLDRTNRRLARLDGVPLPARPGFAYDSDIFRPCEENPRPPALTILGEAGVPTDTHETLVAVACSAEGRLALLTWIDGGEARIRLLGERAGAGDPPVDMGRLSSPITLAGAMHPFSLAWTAADQVAVMMPGVKEAAVYTVSPGSTRLLPVSDLYPLRDGDGGPFQHAVALPPQYSTGTGPLPLNRLAWPAFPLRGQATGARPLDSGAAETVWHRLYLEAAIPPGCRIEVFLAATASGVPPGDDDDWQLHLFGERDTAPADPILAPGGNVADTTDVPRGAWMSLPSEIPFHPGLLPCARQPGRAGLFTALIQRSDRRVRALRGRYLWVRVFLHGDGRSTPEVAALRAYGSRFSYVDNYLPELYRESLFDEDADQRGPSTRADFLERFLGNFEGILTNVEDRIASAHLLTDPATVPPESLEWLASWLGFVFDPAVSTDQRRALLAATPDLYRFRGTLRGLGLALDIVTAGAVRRRQIVVLEDFRLRRVFATILGADLENDDDPLLPGLSQSGNSFVGDTLFLGDEHNKEFLALFSADLRVDAPERAAIDELLDALAFRATVLVHQEVSPQDLALVRRIVDRESPGHVAVRIQTASQRFLIGASSLVGVDTFLDRRPGAQPVTVDRTVIGRGDLIYHVPSLDPRLGGGAAAIGQPLARLEAPDRLPFGQTFTLSAEKSEASAGHKIVRYRWKLIN